MFIILVCVCIFKANCVKWENILLIKFANIQFFIISSIFSKMYDGICFLHDAMLEDKQTNFPPEILTFNQTTTRFS